MPSFLMKMLAEDNGNVSTMRILTAVIIVVVLFNWTYFNMTSGQLTGFSWEDLFALIGPLLAKGYQKGKETPKEVPDETPQ